jgi:hypothetical protein
MASWLFLDYVCVVSYYDTIRGLSSYPYSSSHPGRGGVAWEKDARKCPSMCPPFRINYSYWYLYAQTQRSDPGESHPFFPNTMYEARSRRSIMTCLLLDVRGKVGTLCSGCGFVPLLAHASKLARHQYCIITSKNYYRLGPSQRFRFRRQYSSNWKN